MSQPPAGQLYEASCSQLVTIDAGGDAMTPMHTLIRVDVTDSQNGGGDGATSANTYDVTWHLPADGWQKVGGPVQIQTVVYPNSNVDSRGVKIDQVQPNGTVTCTFPTNEVDVDYAPYLKGASAVCTTSGAVLPLVVEAVGAEVTWPIIVGTGLLALGGYAIDKNADDKPAPSYPGVSQATLAQFINDIADQQQLNANPQWASATSGFDSIYASLNTPEATHPRIIIRTYAVD